MTESKKKREVFAVIDTNVFVPALACQDPEARFYSRAIKTCWKVVISDEISDEYQRVILEYGYRADVVIHELNKLYAMLKYRSSCGDSQSVTEDLAPRKDRHIIAPCKSGDANIVVTHDQGIHSKKEHVLGVTGAEVLTLAEAEARLAAEGPLPA